MGYVQCKCGCVRLVFPATQPRFTAECVCCDCYTRLIHFSVLTGARLSNDFINKKAPAQLNYVENIFRVVRGKDKLRFTKLSQNASVTHMVCADCSSLLIGQHPGYNGNVVFVPGKSIGEINEHDFEGKKPLIRWWIKDWNDEQVAKLSSLPGFYLQDGKYSGTGDWEAALGQAMDHFQAPTSQPPEEENMDTFDSLFMQNKEDVIIYFDNK